VVKSYLKAFTIKVKMHIIQSTHHGVVIGYPTVSSVKVKLCEIHGHFTVIDLCEAYDYFIAHLVGMILTIIKVKLCVIHSTHQCVAIGYPHSVQC